MTTETSTSTDSKKRRIMIITADESIIEQLQNNSNTSLFKSIILDSHGENVELAQLQTNSQLNIPITTTPNNNNNNNKKVKNDHLTCVVCGSPAHGYNFDAISCESCKAFFRRNALKDPATLECRRNNDCDITMESRRRCSACRLTKCLNSGMKRDRLLTAEEKEIKRRKIEENRSLSLQSHSETSDDEQKVQLAVAIPDSKPVSSLKPTNLLLLNDFTELLPQTPRTLLSSEELERVATIKLLFEQRIELAARDGLPWNPSWYANTLLEQINARSISALRLLSFFKQIPEFNELNVEDKFTLVKYNLMPLMLLNCTLAYSIEPDWITEDKSDAPLYAGDLKLRNEDLYNRIKKIFESFARIAQHDQRIIQLALVILILTKGASSNDGATEPMLSDNMGVYRAQSYYTELLWKYLETTHSYGKATQIFNELVSHFISWQTLQERLRQDIRNVLTPAEKNELLPIMKSLLDIS